MKDAGDAGTVDKWLAAFARGGPDTSFDTRHIDELDWNHHRRQDMVEESLACLDEAASAASALSLGELNVRLAIPLRATEMDERVPTWGGLELHELEPPSLYIARDVDVFNRAFVEEFRAVMAAPDAMPGAAAYYVCHRDEREVSLGWECGRTVWVAHEMSA